MSAGNYLGPFVPILVWINTCDFVQVFSQTAQSFPIFQANNHKSRAGIIRSEFDQLRIASLPV